MIPASATEHQKAEEIAWEISRLRLLAEINGHIAEEVERDLRSLHERTGMIAIGCVHVDWLLFQAGEIRGCIAALEEIFETLEIAP